MSSMTVWDERDITRWPEDDDPESLAGGDDDGYDEWSIDRGDWTAGLDEWGSHA